MNTVNTSNFRITEEDWNYLYNNLYNNATSAGNRISQLESNQDCFADKAEVYTIAAQCREIKKLLKLMYKSLGVEPYDKYGKLRPEEDILADLVVANAKINLTIDDMLGGQYDA